MTFNFTFYPFNLKLELMKRSFTVTELLVAIAIVVILAGILIGGIGYAGRRADEAKTIAAMQALSAALEAFRAEKGYYPSFRNDPYGSVDYEVRFYRNAAGELTLCFRGVSLEYKFVDNKGKPFLELGNVTGSTKETYVDAWGKGLLYQCPGTHNKSSFDLFSCGPDQIKGTADDIANWDNASQQ